MRTSWPIIPLAGLIALTLYSPSSWATKPTPLLRGTMELSPKTPHVGGDVMIQLTFFAAMPLTGIQVKLWSQGRDSGKPCLDDRPRRFPVATTSMVPAKPYAILLAAQLLNDQEICDVFLEPTATFGDKVENLGVVFRSSLFDKSR